MTVAPATHAERICERREALRKIIPEVLAGRDEFVWEVGCGHGHFLNAYAAAHPGELCLGVDVTLERIARATRKRDRSQLPNLHFIRADAEDFLAALPPEARFAAVYVLFPDPWPKRRHHKNRLLQARFLAETGARSRPGAPLYLRTDYEPYFRAARAAIESSPLWRLSDAPWPFEAPSVFQARAPRYFSLAAVRGPP